MPDDYHMITIQYLPSIPETITVTLNFLHKRPFVKIILLMAKICCFLMCIAYILKTITHTLCLHDMLVLIFVLFWLFGYRSFNALLLRRILVKNKIDQKEQIFHINKDKIWGTNANGAAIQQLWKHMKYIYQHNDGYVIPSIGKANAGKFIWLPKRGFPNQQLENQFLEILGSYKISIK